eukprot:g4393.t1
MWLPLAGPHLSKHQKQQNTYHGIANVDNNITSCATKIGNELKINMQVTSKTKNMYSQIRMAVVTFILKLVVIELKKTINNLELQLTKVIRMLQSLYFSKKRKISYLLEFRKSSSFSGYKESAEFIKLEEKYNFSLSSTDRSTMRARSPSPEIDKLNQKANHKKQRILSQSVKRNPTWGDMLSDIAIYEDVEIARLKEENKDYVNAWMLFPMLNHLGTR